MILCFVRQALKIYSVMLQTIYLLFEISAKFAKEPASQNQLENVTRPPIEGMAAICFISQVNAVFFQNTGFSYLVSPALRFQSPTAVPKHEC